MKKPNVLLITVDCLRSDVLGCYGGKDNLTPALDSLAGTGMRFTQAMTSGGWTQAAFPAILTSSLPSMYGGCLGSLALERPSLVEALAGQGYATGGFSTNPYVSRLTGYDRGFQYFVDLVPTETNPTLRHVKGGHRLLRSSVTHRVSRLFGRRWRPPRLYSSAAEVNDGLYRWLNSVEGPFFAWAHYMDVHWPYHLEETLRHPLEIAQAWRDLSTMHQKRRISRDRTMTTEERERFLLLYKKALIHLDTQIGRLLRNLDELGYGLETIIVVTADHGEEFLEHGEWGHSGINLYDEILRVPLLIRLPDQDVGTIIERQVRLLDLMPTLLELCGCPIPPKAEGQSMVPLWFRNGAKYDAQESVSEMQRAPRHRIAIRTEAFKYICDNTRPDQPELYDLRIDPAEKCNVHAQHTQVAKGFQASIERHLRRVTKTELAVPPELELSENVVQRLRDLGYVE